MIRLAADRRTGRAVQAGPGGYATGDVAVGSYDAVASRNSQLRGIVEQAAHVAGVPMAALHLMKSSTQRTVAAVGLELSVVDRRDSMCGQVIDQGRPVHVADASQDPRWAANPFVDGRWARIRFYGAHPLVADSGLVLGTLCVFDVRPRVLDAGRVDALEELARGAVRVLEGARLVAHQSEMRKLLTTLSLHV